jgi:methylenetetrahydrofolate dehydrogenase (NADP+)/methenyltetrahydrofolate cyclohydrolase
MQSPAKVAFSAILPTMDTTGIVVDGKALAAELLALVRARVAARPQGAPRLAVIACDPNLPTQKYLALKERTAASVGIQLMVTTLPATATTDDVVAAITAAVTQVAGVVVQLPLPPHIDREVVLAAVPASHDPDGFAYGRVAGACLPPVVGAIAAIAERHHVTFTGQRVVVLGGGRLVGAPAAAWCVAQGAQVTHLTAPDPTAQVAALQTADILISGIGVPHAITSDQVPQGIVIFDAGTSEDGGVIMGDVHPAVARQAGVYTPVPGGIGPLTIALLLQNLLELADRQ